MTTKLREDVKEFMDHVGHNVRDAPNRPQLGDEEVRLRARLVLEEAFEFAMACVGDPAKGFFAAGSRAMLGVLADPTTPIEVDMEEATDALADIDYVVEGARLNFGIDGSPIADEVHRANMAKVTGGKLDEHGKFIKPKNWTPPNIAGRLIEQGWKK